MHVLPDMATQNRIMKASIGLIAGEVFPAYPCGGKAACRSAGEKPHKKVEIRRFRRISTFYANYKSLRLSSSALSRLRYAGGTSNTVLQPDCPSQLILKAALA